MGPKKETIKDNRRDSKQILHNENQNCITKNRMVSYVQQYGTPNWTLLWTLDGTPSKYCIYKIITRTKWYPTKTVWDPKKGTIKSDPKYESIINGIQNKCCTMKS